MDHQTTDAGIAQDAHAMVEAEGETQQQEGASETKFESDGGSSGEMKEQPPPVAQAP